MKATKPSPARKKTAAKNDNAAALDELRAFGLTYPGAHLKSPWPNHMDLAVNDKTFAYLSAQGEPFSIACKLPRSNAAALMLPFAKPTAYGLGKSGWVSAVFAKGDRVPVDMFKEWIDESYRAQAPKKLVAMLDAAKGEGGSASAPKSKPKTKPRTKTKTAKTTSKPTRPKTKGRRSLR